MDIAQNINESSIHVVSGHDVPLKQKWKKALATTASSDNLNQCFDCNICLDAAYDPVVTFCGHLYCWPCIYKWIQVQSSSLESNERPQCPICKAYITSSTLIPLYGRGTSSSDSEVKEVPGRPQALELPAQTSMTSEPNQQNRLSPLQPQQHQQYTPHTLGNYPSLAASSFSGSTVTSSYSPTVWMVGEMVSASFFGSDSNLHGYPQPSSYSPGYSRPMMRRQEMQVDKSLNRVTIFLLCCLVLCLLLF